MSVNHNGKIIPASQGGIPLDNRAFKYGDSLFETIRMFDGELLFLPLHYDRLLEGTQYLQMTPPLDFDLVFVEQEIRRILPEGGNHRIRFMLYRAAGGLYTPQNNDIEYLIESFPLPESFFQINTVGLKVGITQRKYLSYHAISHLKTGNSLPYILAGLERKQGAWDNILLFNQQGEIAEALSSNLFVIIQNKIYTPPLTSGCVAGTMRRFLLEKTTLNIQEENITMDILRQAEALFITNAIQGVQWIEQVNEMSYQYHPLLDTVEKCLNLNY